MRCFALIGTDAMAADLKRGVLDGALDSGGVAPNGGAGYLTTGLQPPGTYPGMAVALQRRAGVARSREFWYLFMALSSDESAGIALA